MESSNLQYYGYLHGFVLVGWAWAEKEKPYRKNKQCNSQGCSAYIYLSWETQLCSLLSSSDPDRCHTFTTRSHLETVQHIHRELETLEVQQTLTHFILTLCRQAVATGDLGLSSLAATEGSALLFQQRPCSAVDRSVHCRRDDRRFRELAYLCESAARWLLRGRQNVVWSQAHTFIGVKD